MAKVFICGMPGSGKSTLGWELSKNLSIPYFDLDEFIELKESRKISEIFENEGESYFRRLEHTALKELIEENRNLKSYVCSLGGGTPCFHSNMDIVNEEGLSLFLNTELSLICERMQSSSESNKRPLIAHIKSSKLLDDLQDKLDKRIDFYQKSHLKIKGDENLVDISFKILNYWNILLKRKSNSH